MKNKKIPFSEIKRLPTRDNKRTWDEFDPEDQKQIIRWDLEDSKEWVHTLKKDLDHAKNEVKSIMFDIKQHRSIVKICQRLAKKYRISRL